MCRSLRLLLLAILTTIVLVPVPAHATNADIDDAGASGTESIESQVEAMLARRIAAIEANDQDAFMATVDPYAPAKFVDTQRNMFSGLHAVPVQDVAFDVQPTAGGDLAPGLGLASSHHADAAYLPQTVFTYRFTGYDDHDAVDGLWWTYVRRGEQWYVAGDDDGDVVGLRSAREVWDFGAVAVQSTKHFLVVSSVDQTQRAGELAGIAEQAYDTFAAQWSQPWSQRLPLIVPRSSQEAARLTQASTDVSQFVAFVTYAKSGGTGSTAPRMLVQDAALSGQSVAAQEATMVHELTHAAAAQMSGTLTPLWLQEGIAEWVRMGKPKSVAVNGAQPHIPDNAEFSGSGIRTAYQLSAAAVAHLSAIGGDALVLRVFRDVGDAGIGIGSPSYRLDAVFREASGMSLAEFVEDWQESV